MTDQPATLAAALAQLQGRLPRITKGDTAEVTTKTGGKYTYSYANLASIHDIVFPLMAEVGLAWSCQPTLRDDGKFVLRYVLMHAGSGENEAGDYPLTLEAPQTMGGLITYARRYALCAVIGIAPAEDDDDAKAAQDAWRPPANPHSRKADRHRADRSGPLPDDQWTTPGSEPADEQKPGTITKAQSARMHAAFNRVKILDRADKLAYAMSVLNLAELETSNNLSYAQAAELIKHLEAEEIR